ncbi:MAG: hypothetical protein U0175_35375 [Caldilineaceae bacterium]
MFENPLKSLTFQSSNFGNEGSGFGTRPQTTTNQSSSSSSGTGNQNNLDSTGGLWGNQATPDMADEQWTELRSQIKQHWKNLSDQDLLMTQGNFEKLCNLIQQHTSQSRQEIASELQQLMNRESESEGSATLKRENKI